MVSSIDVSVIIPCKNEVNTLRSTVDSIMNSQNSLSYEIIVVDDASTDKSSCFLESDLYKNIYKNISLLKTNNVGCSAAKNSGAEIAKGKYLFFCDAHVEVPDKWIDDLVNTLKEHNAHLAAPGVADMYNSSSIGYGETWDNQLKINWITNIPNGVTEIPIACGCCFAITKEAFERVNGFDHLYEVWGKEDEEISLKLWLYGFKVIVNPEVKIKHLFKKKHPYVVTPTNVVYNSLCLAYSHFSAQRLKKAISLLKFEYGFSIATSKVKQNADLILKQREKYFRERKYNDDLFFEKFKIPF